MHIKNRLRKILSVISLFCVIICLLFNCACSDTDSLDDNHSCDTADSYSNEDNASFLAFCNELFKQYVSQDALTLHSYIQHPEALNITDYNHGLSRFNTTNPDNFSYLTDMLNSIQSFDRTTLSQRQQITFDQLNMYFTNELEHSDLFMFDTCLSTTIGLHLQLPIIYAQYPFNEEKDICEYLEILKDTDEFFYNIAEYEAMRNKNGYFFSKDILSTLISQCQTLYENIDTGFLITTFKDKLDNLSLSDNDKTKYINENEEALKKHVKEAYKILFDKLSQITPSLDYSGGLCQYPNGKAYYEYLIKRMLGWSKSIDELNAYLDKYLNLSLTATEQIYSQNSITQDQLNNFSFSLTDPDEILKDLKSKMASDFPFGADIDYTISYVDKCLEDYVSPAMYFTPQLDNIRNNNIFINQAHTNSHNLYTTLAHEGFPGHMYQITYFADSAPDLIRYLLAPGGYTEGWATYCEALSYSYADSNNPLINQILSNNYIAILCLYGKIDIGVNYYGWNEENVKKLLSDYGLPDSSSSEIYNSMLCEPANYCQYILGYIAICELKNEYKEKTGESFNLKSFHQYILDIGPAPFDILFSNMDHSINHRHNTN